MRARRSAFIMLLATLGVPAHAACPDAPTFTPGHYAANGVNPRPGFIADLNHDQKGDLVVFHHSGGIQVFLGSASGILTPLPNEFNSNDPFTSVAPGDVNSDGNVDAIAGVISEIRIEYGTGIGTFSAGPVLPLSGGGALAERVADFNNDGLPDIAATTVSGDIELFLQTAPGTFAAPAHTFVAFPENMEVADIDGDGKQDIAVALFDDKVAVLFGNGDGTFATPLIIDLGITPITRADSIVIHDFNADGRLDFAVGIFNRGVQIVRNDGSRTFSLAQQITEAKGASVALGDFNADSIVDLFASGFGGFYIIPANADGTFRTPQFTAVPELGSGSGATSSKYVLGDFRGIRRVDVATTPFARQTIEVDLNDCENFGVPALSPIALALLAASCAIWGALALKRS